MKTNTNSAKTAHSLLHKEAAISENILLKTEKELLTLMATQHCMEMVIMRY